MIQKLHFLRLNSFENLQDRQKNTHLYQNHIFHEASHKIDAVISVLKMSYFNIKMLVSSLNASYRNWVFNTSLTKNSFKTYHLQAFYLPLFGMIVFLLALGPTIDMENQSLLKMNSRLFLGILPLLAKFL